MSTDNTVGLLRKAKRVKPVTWWVVGGVVGGAALLYMRRVNTPTVDNIAPADDTYDDSGTTDTGYDPTDSGAYGYSMPDGSITYGSPYGSIPTTVVGGNTMVLPTTNAQWYQQCVDYLEDHGYDPTSTAAALGKYLAKAELTQAQAEIVEAAIGAFGYPPNNPGTPRVANNPTQTDRTKPAAPKISLRKNYTRTTDIITFSPVSHATLYRLYADGKYNKTVAGAYHFEVLAYPQGTKKHHSYKVIAYNGTIGSNWSNTITV
jgi:hypothetical protein